MKKELYKKLGRMKIKNSFDVTYNAHELYRDFETTDKNILELYESIHLREFLNNHILELSELIQLPLVACQAKIEDMDFTVEEHITVLKYLILKEG